jgi:ubiquinone/menaquinone biosynthesis C-methylase UbiE
VADIGCGNGNYVVPVAERLTRDAVHVVGDVSPGMLRGLRSRSTLAVINLDVNSLPLPTGACDVILVNHVLHHIRDVNRAVAECSRVLRKGGWLLAATNSLSTMAELPALIHKGFDRLGIPSTAPADNPFSNFSLESGQAILVPWFGRVERHLLHNALVFPEPAPLLAFVDSGRGLYETDLPPDVHWDDLLDVWRDLVAEHITRHGEFRVNKISGAFVATKD